MSSSPSPSNCSAGTVSECKTRVLFGPWLMRLAHVTDCANNNGLCLGFCGRTNDWPNHKSHVRWRGGGNAVVSDASNQFLPAAAAKIRMRGIAFGILLCNSESCWFQAAVWKPWTMDLRRLIIGLWWTWQTHVTIQGRSQLELGIFEMSTTFGIFDKLTI